MSAETSSGSSPSSGVTPSPASAPSEPAAKQSPAPAQPPPVAKATSPPAKQAHPPVAKAASPPAKQAATTTTKQTEVDDDGADMSHRSVDNIVSVGVVAWELDLLSKQPQTEETEHRKMELEGKQAEIMTQIQIGAMQMEDYAAALKARIEVDKLLAKKLAQQGRKPEAMYCLQRAKKMEDELNS